LEKVLPFVINEDQYAYSCTSKNRTISDAVRSIDDIMEYTRINQLPGLMVEIYFEKSFDSLSWNFLSNALRSFNFGDSLINWISVFTPTFQVVSKTMVSRHQCFKSKEMLDKAIRCRHTSSL